MSGGSFDYLCYKDWPEICQRQGTIREMADFLASLGYAQDAARLTEDLLVQMRLFEVRVTARLQQLQLIWQAAEWWRSCDYSEDTFKEVLARWRGEAEPAPQK